MQIVRPRHRRLVAGVCAAVGYWAGIQPLLIRAALVVLFIMNVGLAIILYAAGWLLIPEQRRGEPIQESDSKPEPAVIAGLALVVLGAALFLDQAFPALLRSLSHILGPLALIGIGFLVILTRRK